MMGDLAIRRCGDGSWQYCDGYCPGCQLFKSNVRTTNTTEEVKMNEDGLVDRGTSNGV